MTREEAKKELSKLIFELGFEDNIDDKICALNMAIKALSQEPISLNDINNALGASFRNGVRSAKVKQEPCEDIAQERYKDLCEYFGDAKDILKSREDFKAWLERVKWHIRKAEELYEKYEYKKEPCDDAISREKTCDYIAEFVNNEYSTQSECDMVDLMIKGIKHLPSVTQKSGKWILLDECANSGYYCSICQKKLVKEGWSNTVKKVKYCPNCGAKMESEVNNG